MADATETLYTAPHLRWAVIGCGVIANEMAQALALEGRHLAGIANRTREKAVAFAEKYGVEKVYDSYEELYADPGIDAVYITTPHNTHIDFMRACLSAGKHVLCEKSITLNSEELAEGRRLAAENGVVLMDATTILHMPLYRELVRRAKAGEFGRMNVATINFGSLREYDERSRFFSPDLAGGAMLDIGVYAFTVARIFMESQPTEIRSLMNRAPSGVDDSSAIVMRNPEGQLATFMLTLRSKQPKRAMISFDKCYIESMEYPRADAATITWVPEMRVEEVRAGERRCALAYEIADLEAAVAGDEEKLGLIEIASDVMDLMTQCRRAWGVSYPEERAAGLA